MLVYGSVECGCPARNAPLTFNNNSTKLPVNSVRNDGVRDGTCFEALLDTAMRPVAVDHGRC